DLEKALRPTRPDLRQPSERGRRFPVLADEPDTAGTLAHDDPAVWEEVEREPAGKPGRHRVGGIRLSTRGARRVRLAEPGGNRRVAVRRRAAVGRRVRELCRGTQNCARLLT